MSVLPRSNKSRGRISSSWNCRLLRRCLERDRNRRLHDIADARLELAEPADETVPRVASPARNPRWLIPALGIAILAAIALAAVHFRETPAPPMVRFQIPMPAQSAFGNHVSISPDGRLIAFEAAGAGGRNLIYVPGGPFYHAAGRRGSVQQPLLQD
jgi:hypothetical protein